MFGIYSVFCQVIINNIIITAAQHCVISRLFFALTAVRPSAVYELRISVTEILEMHKHAI